ncbi:MAG: magnesium chelatase subunit [Acidobacteriota bacterium]|nr:magnesium chelatase subunit [Acidobacteriota bacterium]
MAAGRPTHNSTIKPSGVRPVFPFTAIVAQEEMKLALLLNVVAPSVGGVFITGHRGTGKSTAVRALADLLPPLTAVRGCAYNCDPADDGALCDECAARASDGSVLKRERKPIPVVELPLGATEDRVCGTIDIARALKEGVKSFEPGLLARANRGFLYIDEVNLLEDHLVDLLLDVAATGRNLVEREGVSAEHPSRFRLVGSGNPEEGELRPQLLDRFGLCVEVETIGDLESRVLIVEHREAFDADPSAFNAAQQAAQSRLRKRVVRAAGKFASVEVARPILHRIAELCMRLGVDGHRGEITVTRAARALAALEGRGEVSREDVRRVAAMALRHRLRRDPLEQGGAGARVETLADEMFGDGDAEAESSSGDAGRGTRRTEKFSGKEMSAETAAGGDHRAGERRQDSDGVCTGDRVETSIDVRGVVDMNGDGRGVVGGSERELVVPPAELALRREAFARKAEAGEGGRHTDSAARRRDSTTRRRAGARTSEFAARGRYAGASHVKTESGGVALDATLRAAAGLRAAGMRVAPESLLTPESLRFKRFRGKTGSLFIFLVDTSGSMAANRIAQAKGALAVLLRRSYVNRDRIALVSFREGGAELLLAPCASASRARALLDALPIGGATPLAAGLLRALEIARRAAAESARRVRLVVFTDGRANVPLAGKGSLEGAAKGSLKGGARDLLEGAGRGERIRDEILALGASLKKAGVSSLVIDTQSRFTAGGEGRFLSDAIGGRFVRLPQLFSEAALSDAVGDA